LFDSNTYPGCRLGSIQNRHPFASGLGMRNESQARFQRPDALIARGERLHQPQPCPFVVRVGAEDVHKLLPSFLLVAGADQDDGIC
jgi:hypothetical protein